MTLTKEQRIAALLRVLLPAPDAWVTAASEIPRLERELANPPTESREPAEEHREESSPRSADR